MIRNTRSSAAAADAGRSRPLSPPKFRVNANKNKVDIWLIYQCARCRHTLNIPVYERINPGKLPRELYERFLENDRELATRYASDIRFLKSRHYVTAKNFPKNR